MDKLEYIPGDLVKFATNTYTIVNFEENFLHNKICYALISTNSTKTAFVADRDILPIPITPEILEKNGWKKSKINDCAYFYYKDGLFLTYTSKDDKFWFDDFDYSRSICVDLHYVHSLHHLLFGLGINSEMEVYVWK